MASSRKAPAPDVRRNLEQELGAATALKHQLGEAFGNDGDTDLLRDMIEGETNLDGAVDAVLAQMALDLASVEGIKLFKKTLDARSERLGNRIETMRSMLLNALDIVELPRLERPLALLTRKSTPPKLLITDEAAIPSHFYRTPEPELSKADLTRALKDRRDTIEQKLAEIEQARQAGSMPEDDASEARARLVASFPPIPGAELDNGSIAIQVKWS